MRRLTRMLSIGLVLICVLAGLAWSGAALAQEATPAADEPIMEGDGSFELVTFASGVSAFDPADLIVVRVTLDPGTVSPFDDADPMGGILIVESGAITVRASKPWTVTRGVGLMAAMATAEATGDMSGAVETIAADAEMTLAAGDAAYIPGNVDGLLRNDGQEPAVGLGFLIGPAGAMMGATPTP